jgi:hypothetical protein
VGTFRDSPGLRRLAQTAARIEHDFAPTIMTIVMPVIDLSLERKLIPGERLALPAFEAQRLVDRGFARR